MRQIPFLLLLLILSTAPTLADEALRRTNFKSPNGRFELNYLSGENSGEMWSLVEKETGAVLYKLTGNLRSQAAFISNDGRGVVVLDNFSEQDSNRNPDVLVFYRDGKPIQKYRLGDLVRNPANLSHSVSHFTWFFEDRGVPPVIRDGRLSLQTYELVRYEFDAATGRILHREVDPALSPGALYVYGKVDKTGPRRFTIKPCHLVQGTLPKNGRVDFEAEPGDLEDYAYMWKSLVIQNGKLVKSEPVMLNECNLEKSARR
jgi:hypothetical protein